MNGTRSSLFRGPALALGLGLAQGLPLAAADSPLTQAQSPAGRQVDFVTEIRPILEQNCFRCHGPTRAKGGLRLDQKELLLKGGDNGPVVITGDSTNSPLIRLVARVVPDSGMPPAGQGDPLRPDEVALLRAWIDQGAPWDGDGEASALSLSVAPAIGYVSVRGNEAQFRQHAWLREGWRGGIESFEFGRNLSSYTRLAVSGHALTDDYLAQLTIARPDRGFLEFGFAQFRKYDSDTGGYYPSFTPSVLSLDRDLHLDTGRAWTHFGLTLPDWPRMTLGYEYQYREGEKATLQWGAVTDGTTIRNIFPAYKSVDEETHVLTFDVEFERGGWRLEDNFRGEWTDLRTRQSNVPYFELRPPNTLIQDNIRQGWRSFEGANTVRVERQFKPWLFSSAGYLYSQLSGDADFNLDRAIAGGPLLQQYLAERIVLDRESQVANANLMLGPWEGGTLSLGVQGEWSRQNGDLNGEEFIDPAATTNRAWTEIDRVAVDESALLRFTRLPLTTLFAEARLQQECLAQSENVVGDLPPTFLRETDAESDLYEVRTGFDITPGNGLKLGSHYRWRDRTTRYDGVALDSSDPFAPIVGYPTHITGRDLTTQEIESRLTLRPNAWCKTTFTWRLVATDYRTTTRPVSLAAPGDDTPGGQLLAGNYDAQIFSLHFTASPWRRFNGQATVSWQEVRTSTLPDNQGAVVPYRGDLWSVLCSGRYRLTQKTDLTAGYTFSTADFQQDNFSAGLPLGTRYDLHGLQAGLQTRCTKHLTTKLHYGYYRYTEPSSGGANDYTAHAVFVSLAWQLN